MEKLFKYFSLIVIVSFIMTSFSNFAYADNDEGIGYSVQKIPSDKEKKNSESFYDLLVSPGEKVTLEAKINNPTDKEIVVKSEIFTAGTNTNGEISYTTPLEDPDKSLEYPIADFSEVISSDIKAKIPPNSDKIVTAEVNVPEEFNEGVLLGSWYFEKEGQEPDVSESSGININNKYSYAMAIKVTVNKEIDTPNLNLLNVNASLNNYRKVINANIQNNQPAILSKLNVKAEVMKKGSYDVLYSNEIKDIIMAPNSNYPFPVFLNSNPIVAGDYTMKLVAESEDPKWEHQKWEWSEDFTITSQEANSLNEEAINDPEPEKLNIRLYIIIGTSLLFVLLIIIIYLVVKNKKEKKKKSSKKRAKKSKKVR